MGSDLRNIKDSGRQCVGCARGPEKVMLMRLRTYSRSLTCAGCFIKYAICENVTPLGKKCHHDPREHQNKTGHCRLPGCGCPRWIHGLEDEHDRQYAAGIGKTQQSKECQGYGQNLGKCGNLIFVHSDGTIGRLCDTCERNWTQEVMGQHKGMNALFNLNEKKQLPN